MNVIPRFNFPAIFLERIIRSDLPVNLQALACRSESNFEGNQSVITEDTFPSQALYLGSEDTKVASALKNKGASEDIKEKFVKAAFGPLSPSTGELNSNWGIFGKSCPLDRPCMVDEVHLRRFDGLLVIVRLCSIFYPSLENYFSVGSHKLNLYHVEGKWGCSQMRCRQHNSKSTCS